MNNFIERMFTKRVAFFLTLIGVAASSFLVFSGVYLVFEGQGPLLFFMGICLFFLGVRGIIIFPTSYFKITRISKRIEELEKKMVILDEANDRLDAEIKGKMLDGN